VRHPRHGEEAILPQRVGASFLRGRVPPLEELRELARGLRVVARGGQPRREARGEVGFEIQSALSLRFRRDDPPREREDTPNSSGLRRRLRDLPPRFGIGETRRARWTDGPPRSADATRRASAGMAVFAKEAVLRVQSCAKRKQVDFH
jgi:hypothetical protein